MAEHLKAIHLNRAELLNKIGHEVTIITGNSRLTDSIRNSCDQKAVDEGLQAWESPDIIPWGAWIMRCFREGPKPDALHAPVLISDWHEQGLWEQIIVEASTESPLLQVSATARQAAETWRLTHEWELEQSQDKHWQNEDTRAFQKWAKRLQKRCLSKNWTTRAQLPGLITEWILARQFSVPDRIILTGFDEITPRQLSLINACEEQGCIVEWIEKSGLSQSVCKLKVNNYREEIVYAAHWARVLLEEKKTIRLGIVVPELKEMREVIQGIFDKVFSPENIKPGTELTRHPYNISMGRPLIQYPVIQTLFLILSLKNNSVAVEEFSALLRSPFITGWEEEMFSRSQLDKRIREAGNEKISIRFVNRLACRSDRQYFSRKIAVMLESVDEGVNKMPARALPGFWAGYITRILDGFGYLKGRTLSSDEYQTAEAWKDVLCEFIKLDMSDRKITLGSAVSILRQIAAERIFQPRTNEAPVQVLGVMEAIGLEFEKTWIMGLHDCVWPPVPRPDPFIPFPLQREKNMPHSSASRELEFAEKITSRLIGNAAESIISYPCMDETDILRPSALLNDIDKVHIEQLLPRKFPDWCQLIFQSGKLESIQDNQAPPVRGRDVSGGSQIIKLQSLCPFRAFAELRLAARPLQEPTIGLDPSERGSLVHQALEYFWREVRTGAQLQNLSADALHDQVDRCVSRAMTKMEKELFVDFKGRFRVLEHNRLKTLMLEWLENEKSRQPFHVLMTEQKVKFATNSIDILLKVDRVDEMDDGSRIVIDYKTGKVSPYEWFGDRPGDPQLPLYVSALPEKLAGVVFGQIRPGECAFKGVMSGDINLPGVKNTEKLLQTRGIENWTGLLDYWKACVNKLADEFARGEAMVDPLSYPATCKYCSLKSLCRINEIKNTDQALDEEDYGS